MKHAHRKPLVIVLRGPIGVGKTTVAHLLRERLAPAIRLSVDTIRYLANPRTFAKEELRAAKKSAVAMANIYARAGFSAIIESVFFDPSLVKEIEQMVRSAGGTCVVITLRARLSNVLARNGARAQFDRSVSQRVRNIWREYPWNVGTIINTDSRIAEEVASEILEMLSATEETNQKVPVREGKICLFARHGEHFFDSSSYPKDDRGALSETGIATAHRLAEEVALFAPERIISSCCTRAHETATICAENIAKRMRVNVDRRLNERFLSSLAGLSHRTIAERHSKAFLKTLLTRSEEIVLKGEESVGEAQERVAAALNDALRKVEQRVLVVSHGGPHSWLCCRLLGLPLSESRRFPLQHGHFSLFAFDRHNKFTSLQALNCPSIVP